MPTINSSWPRHSTTYVGLKGQAGRVVTGVFINPARRNAALNKRLESCEWREYVCSVHVCTLSLSSTAPSFMALISFGTLNSHYTGSQISPQLLQKNWAQETISRPGWVITAVSCRAFMLKRGWSNKLCAEEYTQPRFHLFSNVLNQNYTEHNCHLIPDSLINMSLKDLQEKLLYACKLIEGGGLW